MNLWDRLDSPQLEPLLMVLVHLLWQATLVALVWQVGLFVIGRGRPHARYTWSLIALVAIAMTPGITLLCQPLRMTRLNSVTPAPTLGQVDAIHEDDGAFTPVQTTQDDVENDWATTDAEPSALDDLVRFRDKIGSDYTRGDYTRGDTARVDTARVETTRDNKARDDIALDVLTNVDKANVPFGVDSEEAGQVAEPSIHDDFAKSWQSTERSLVTPDPTASIRDLAHASNESLSDSMLAQQGNAISDPTSESEIDRGIVLPMVRQVARWVMMRVREQQAVLLLMWWVGLVLFSVKLSAGSIACLRMRRTHEPLSPLDQTIVDHLAGKLGMRARTSIVRVSQLVSEAIAVGIWRPIILMPIAWLEQLPPATVQAILAHELAHLRRYDLAINLMQRVVETCFFFHPAVWWISNSIRFERECCCDQVAVRATGNRVAYAKALAEVAHMRLACQPPGLVASFLGGKRMNLLKRVQCLLDKTPRRRTVRLSSLTAFFVLTSVASLSAMTVLGPQDDEPRRDDQDRVERRERQRANVDRERTQEEREARRERRRRAREAREERQRDPEAARDDRVRNERVRDERFGDERFGDERVRDERVRGDRVQDERMRDERDPRPTRDRAPESFDRLPRNAPTDREFAPQDQPRQNPFGELRQRDARGDSPFGRRPGGPGTPPPGSLPQADAMPPGSDPYAGSPPGWVGPNPDSNTRPDGEPRPTRPGEMRPRSNRADASPGDGPFGAVTPPSGRDPRPDAQPFGQLSNPREYQDEQFGTAREPFPSNARAPRAQRSGDENEELLRMMREMRDELRQLRREVETLRMQVEPNDQPRRDPRRSRPQLSPNESVMPAYPAEVPAQQMPPHESVAPAYPVQHPAGGPPVAVPSTQPLPSFRPAQAPNALPSSPAPVRGRTNLSEPSQPAAPVRQRDPVDSTPAETPSSTIRPRPTRDSADAGATTPPVLDQVLPPVVGSDESDPATDSEVEAAEYSGAQDLD